MELRDWMILTFTFIVGVLSGMYFYTTSYKPIYEEKSGANVSLTVGDFDIIGVTYGGLTSQDYVHPSFKIRDDGTYDYFEGGTTKVDKFEGKLPKNLSNALKNEVASSDLSYLSESALDKNCASYSDGIEFEYNIKYKGVEYELDTCLTKFENNTSLGIVLLEVWKFMNKPEEYRFSITNSPDIDSDGEFRGLRGYFEDGFRESGFED